MTILMFVLWHWARAVQLDFDRTRQIAHSKLERRSQQIERGPPLAIPPPGAVSDAPENAFYDGSEPFPNINMATLGYNIFYGDPLPIFPSTADVGEAKQLMDPGLRKPLFQIDYSKKQKTADNRHTLPDGYYATVDEGCSTAISTKEIHDMFEYRHQQSSTYSIGARAEASVAFPPANIMGGGSNDLDLNVGGKAFARVGGTMSYQQKATQDEKKLRTNKMFKSSAKCVSYVAALSYAALPSAHQAFQTKINNLGDAQTYYKLFDEFGTHMLTTIKFGARHGESIFIEKSNVTLAMTTANGFGLSLEASVGAVLKAKVNGMPKGSGVKKAVKKEAKVNLISPPEQKAASELERLIDDRWTSIVGPPLISGSMVRTWMDDVKKDPVPISWEQREICFHPSFLADSDKEAKCFKFLGKYCEEHLKPKGSTCEPASEKSCYNDIDCKDGFRCRAFECVPLPECKVTIYDDYSYAGSSYTLPVINDEDDFGGKIFDLKIADWRNRIASVRLSDGCMKVEAVDDDGSCDFGKSDNAIMRSSWPFMPYDLLYDVCKIKAWAKPLARDSFVDLASKSTKVSKRVTGADRAIDGDSDTSDKNTCTFTGKNMFPWWEVDLGEKFDIYAVQITNGKVRWRHKKNDFKISVDGLVCASGKSVAAKATSEIECEGQGRHVRIQPEGGDRSFKLCEVAIRGDRVAGEAQQASSLIREKTGQPRDVQVQGEVKATARMGGVPSTPIPVPNIGKALYGYNHYYGAPASVENAGTDPGFAHRPLWAAEYAKGAKIQISDLTGILGDRPVLKGNRTVNHNMVAPDGWSVTYLEAPVCTQDYESKEIKSAYDYQNEMASSVNPLGFLGQIGMFSFSFTSEFRSFTSTNSKYRKAMVMTTAECAEYVAEITDLSGSPPPTSDNFQLLVGAAASVEDFYGLFDLFGLHFPTKIVFGARYGLTQQIEETNYSHLHDSSSSSAIKAEYDFGLPKIAAKTGVTGTITVGVSDVEKESESTADEYSSFFEERKECSLGKRMPVDGVDSWVQEIAAEPMPIKYALESICSHPGVASKKSLCEKASSTYCVEHLSVDDQSACASPEEPECLWDMDCPAHSRCTSERKCSADPSCTVTFWNSIYFGDHSKEYGPFYFSDAPHGRFVDALGALVRKVLVSGGCEEVVLLDMDNLDDYSSDNMVISNRDSDNTIEAILPYHLQSDLRGFKVLAKKNWLT